MGRAWLQLKGVAPTCVPCPICRRSDKGVPAWTERGPSSERMGETREGNCNISKGNVGVESLQSLPSIGSGARYTEPTYIVACTRVCVLKQCRLRLFTQTKDLTLSLFVHVCLTPSLYVYHVTMLTAPLHSPPQDCTAIFKRKRLWIGS
jgi:hypothetical protein